MESYIVPVMAIDKLTHDVLRIRVGKPAGYDFTPGQATEVAINKEFWKTEKRPFTFTCLPDDDYLEFIIKTYPARNGVTNQLLQLEPGNELIIHDVWGAIRYKGQGIFIAGGAGITPFISIFRYLAAKKLLSGNRLVFANKTKQDIILENELKELLGNETIHVLSEESLTGYRHGFITEQLLKEIITDYTDNFYVCGPPPMMDAVMQILSNLGVSEKSVIMEI